MSYSGVVLNTCTASQESIICVCLSLCNESMSLAVRKRFLDKMYSYLGLITRTLLLPFSDNVDTDPYFEITSYSPGHTGCGFPCRN